MLGRGLGESNVARFQWTQPQFSSKTQSGLITAQAACWRSAGNMVHTTANICRNGKRGATARELARLYADVYTQLVDHFSDTEDSEDSAARTSWLNALNSLHHDVLQGRPAEASQMAQLGARALRQAQALDRRITAQAKREFKDWINGGCIYRSKFLPLLPGRNAFRFPKGPQGWSPPAYGDAAYNDEQRTEADSSPVDYSEAHAYSPMANQDVLLNEQGEVDKIADTWARLWKKGAPQFCPPDGDLGDQVTPITANDLREAARTFPAGTGRGADDMAPRAVASVPKTQLAKLAQLLNECEKQGRWPQSCELVLIVLLPKADGGKRPIGLFPSTVRLWMRARSRVLRKWERDDQRSGIFGGKGMSATRASWAAAFRGENASHNTAHYAQVLLDLEKAFESVPHKQLWDAAARRGYPLSILRLSLAAYKLPRAVGCDGVFSRLISASREITAGSGTATSELRALTIDLYDILARCCPDVIQSIYVDDINLEAATATKRIKTAGCPADARSRKERVPNTSPPPSPRRHP